LNAWEIFITVASWLGLILGLAIIAFIVWLFFEAMLDTIAKRLRQRRDDLDQYLGEARVIADNFHNVGPTGPDFRSGFLAGVRWAWGYFHRITK
jgi:hypothetical protein